MLQEPVLPDGCEEDTFVLGSLWTGAQAAAGSQAAAQRPAHQTRSEDHEVSAPAEGELFYELVHDRCVVAQRRLIQ